MKSKIINEHISGCWAKKMMDDGKVPTEWNVMADYKVVLCDENANEVDPSMTGNAKSFFEIQCANDDCPAKKRISFIAFANI